MNVELLEVLRFTPRKKLLKTPPRPCYALSFRLQGEGKLITESYTVCACRKDLLLVPKGIAYDHIAENEDIIVFHFNIYDTAFDKIKALTPADPAPYEGLFTQALALWQQKEPGYRYRVQAVLYNILALMEQEGLLHLNQSDAMMATCRDDICARFSDPALSVATLAEKYHISVAYFRRRFKAAVGMGPKEYLTQKRMEQALALLQLGYYSQTEIAEMCGYRDVKYFREAFRRHYGQPISKYLRQALAAQ